MSDLIYRQAAIEAILAIKDYGNSERANALGLAELAVTTLPSAQPELIRPKARDVYYEETDHCEFKCSLCGATIGVVEGGTLDGACFRFCPNCGAELEDGDG